MTGDDKTKAHDYGEMNTDSYGVPHLLGEALSLLERNGITTGLLDNLGYGEIVRRMGRAALGVAPLMGMPKELQSMWAFLVQEYTSLWVDADFGDSAEVVRRQFDELEQDWREIVQREMADELKTLDLEITNRDPHKCYAPIKETVFRRVDETPAPPPEMVYLGHDESYSEDARGHVIICLIAGEYEEFPATFGQYREVVRRWRNALEGNDGKILDVANDLYGAAIPTSNIRGIVWAV